MNRVTLTLIALTTLALTSLAQAQNYPSQYPYLCDTELPWGDFQERIYMRMTNSGGVRHGNLQIHTEDGHVLDNQAILRNGVRLGFGVWAWRLELPDAGIDCDFLNTLWGQEIAVGNCSHGGRMRCVRQTPQLRQEAVQRGCMDCGSLPVSEMSDCYSACWETVNSNIPTPQEVCTQDLVSLIKCMWILFEMPEANRSVDIDDFGMRPQGATCEWSGECGNSIDGYQFCINGQCTPHF